MNMIWRYKLKFGDWNLTLESLTGQIRGLIAETLEFDKQLETWFKNFKTKDQLTKDAWL